MYYCVDLHNFLAYKREREREREREKIKIFIYMILIKLKKVRLRRDIFRDYLYFSFLIY